MVTLLEDMASSLDYAEWKLLFAAFTSAMCMSVAKAAGTITHEKYLMPSGKSVPSTSKMCKECKRFLCDECDALWDHEHNRAPLVASPCEGV